MATLDEQILAAVSRKNYQPVKLKILARKLGLPASEYSRFRSAVKNLVRQGRLEIGRNQSIRPIAPHGTVTGVFRKNEAGFGFVRPHAVDGTVGPEIYIPEESVGDAATGDEVLVRLRRKPSRPHLGPRGEIVQVIERATRQFVGTYFEREGQSYVRVDGTVFSHSIYVGDPGAKGARKDDKVVIEMLRFPSPEDRGEGVIIEVLGPRGKPGVDTLSIIRALGLPEKFSEDALEEGRAAAAGFDERNLDGREDATGLLTITIDPPDARDFDDAVSLALDPKSKHWQLGVHIADVGHFVPPGSALDREARARGTSVYLPQRVLPMLPEIISNSLASLQQGRVRYVMSVFMDFTPAGQRTSTRITRAAICVRRRFNYDEVSQFFNRHHAAAGEGNRKADGHAGRRRHGPAHLEPEIAGLLLRMRELAMILRSRRMKRGALQLEMPEIDLEYDDQGRVTGAHFAKNDISHQIIEDFMLAANEAVAEHLDSLGVPFLRRIHPAPDPAKLKAFAEFARTLGYKIQRETDRFTLQRVLAQAAGRADVHAVNYALLRSLKQAVYSPEEEGHYALASDDYCHFTSPIRRYPDLTIHRLLERWLRTSRAGSNVVELAALGDHCSKMERRADLAERELIKLKLLTYLSERIGLELNAIITGVADYGFFAQGEHLPVEGLVHISTLTDDYYHFDEANHTLVGKRSRRRFRLGDKVRVKVVRVDVQRRQLDLRVTKAGK
jgi:ribonuclease R